jgi:hypothetical protein
MAKSTAQRQAEFRARRRAELAAHQAAEPGHPAAEPEDMPNGTAERDGMPNGKAMPEQPQADVVAIGTEVLKRLKRFEYALTAISSGMPGPDACRLACHVLGLDLPATPPAPAPAVPTAAIPPAAQEQCPRCGGTRFYVLNGERRCVCCMPAGVPRGYLAKQPAEASA